MAFFLDIPIDIIYSTRNIRTEELDLAPSLAEHGLLEPIQVYKFDDGYAVKDGHQRLEAAIKLKWDFIFAQVVSPPEDEVELLIHQLIINEHRKGLSYLERAQVFKRLFDLGQTQVEIAKKFGTTNDKVSLALSLLNAAPAIQALVEEERISPSAIEPILALEVEEQETLAPAVAKAKTVRRVKALANAHKRRRKLTEREAERITQIPDDMDPLEQLAIEEAKEALVHLENVTKVEHPSLQEQLLVIVNRLAARLTLLQLELDRSGAD